jgi:phosphoribosyl-AMP cyclohydrolase
MDAEKIWNGLRKRTVDGRKLVIAIAQDVYDKEVLMTAYQDKDAFKKTLEKGEMHYYSTSKKKLWRKGEQSENIQMVKEIRVDCDKDALLYLVEQVGGACHDGYFSCFYRDLNGKILGKRVFDPEKVY